METRWLTIEEKHRQSPGSLASLNDFGFTPGDVANPTVMLNNPQLSLYCFDDANRQAIFVALPTDVDLTKVPFVYMAQYEHANRLLALPYETFKEVAWSLPEVQKPILIYINGRSGSTLLCHAFNESGVVTCLSEPDAATQLLHLRENGNSLRDGELRQLTDATMRVLFKSYQRQGMHRHALKFRGEGLRIMDLLHSIFPDACNLYLYRDIHGWVRSWYRLFTKAGFPEQSPVQEWQNLLESMFRADLSHLRSYVNSTDLISIPEQVTLWWVVLMEAYLVQVEQGVPVLAVNYSDLNGRPEETLHAIFSYCDLPTDAVRHALTAFERDSQEGTFLARDNPQEGNRIALTPEQERSVQAIVERHPILGVPDFIVPHTFGATDTTDSG